MRAKVVIIVQVISQGSAQVIFADDDQMIETLSADRANYAFGVWILPGTSGRRDHFFDPHSSCPPLKIMSIDRIPVSDQKAWGGVFRKRLDQLLGSPGGCWMLRDVEMNDL